MKKKALYKKALYMETTQISAEKTALEIQALLKIHGLSKFMIDYNKGEMSGVTFSINIKDNEVPYKMPVRTHKLWEKAKRGETKHIRNEEQARRVAWRQLFRWVQAQLAFIESDQSVIEETFLPYMIVDHQKQLTVFNKYENQLPSLKGGK